MAIWPKKKSERIRLALLTFVLSGLFVHSYALPYLYLKRYQPQIGDIVFQSLPKSDLVNAIEGITESPYSHCGVIVHRDGKWMVIEAIGEVRYEDLSRWVRRGRGGRFEAYRLNNNYTGKLDDFIAAMERYLGHPYDIHYDMDEDFIYCSELVYKGFQKATGEELGQLKKLGEMNWEPYRETILKYEGRTTLPLDREMITPLGVTQAPQLVKIYGRL